MKTYFLTVLFLFIFSTLAISQTIQKENENFTKKFNSGEITPTDYKSVAAQWKEMLNDIGGYPELPFNEEKGIMEFKIVKDFTYPKEVIFNRILEWASINFGSISAVMNYNNINDGKIILKGNFDVTFRKDFKNFWGNKKESMSHTTCYQTYVFTMKDQKLKIEVIGIRYEYFQSGYVVGGIYVPEKKIEFPINELYPITDFESDKWKENLTLLQNTKNKINSMAASLNTYIESRDLDYQF